jgi:beta-lactamase superfamily II metal-dependent hydrolase
LEAVKPDIAIYSASNFFPGFPDETVINRLRSVGAMVYGTNFNGNITIDTDGKTYSVTPEKGEPLLPIPE